MEPLQILVVDDETPARLRLLELLEKQPDVNVIGVGRNGTEVVRFLQTRTPDLLFLDVQMPVMNGFEVLRRLNPKQVPATIFVTGYDKYAISAFEAHALDYLLKPFSDERFEAALQRARDHIRTRAAGELGLKLARLLEKPEPPEAAPYFERVVLKSGGHVVFLSVDDIDWVEGAGVYVNLHVGPKAYLYRASVGQLQEHLDPKRFVRVHRSAIVNTDRIIELQARTHGEYGVVLKGGMELTLSRGFRSQFEGWLRQSL